MTEITMSPEEAFGALNRVETKNAPPRFFMRGDVGLLREGSRVSLVGSRKASQWATDQTRSLASFFAQNGVHVVSGLAAGIDAAAHRGAIDAGGRTIAVIGTPLATAYPAAHRALQEEIANRHLLLSQFAPGSPVFPKNFPIRNRTMALISEATIIVEAQDKSGSLHQGYEALRLGRQLYILEDNLRDTNKTWHVDLRRYGAIILRNDSPEQVLEALPRTSRYGGTGYLTGFATLA